MKKQIETTVVITTYNRYPFLYRLLKYYEPYLEELKILILDSSSDQLPEYLKPYLNHPHIIHQTFDPSIFLVKKLAEGIPKVSTPYSLICADDDFIVHNGIKKSVVFLKSNPDYICAFGKVILHYLRQDEETREWRMKFGPLYEGAISISEVNAKKRLKRFFPDNYIGYYYYAVYRTHILKKIWTETNYFVSDWGLAEVFPVVLSSILGKMKILPILYASRERNTYTWIDAERHKIMYSTEKCEKAIEGLAIHLQQVDQMNFKEAKEVVRNSLMTYLERANLRFIHKENSSKSTSKIRGLKNRLRIRTRLSKLRYSLLLQYPFSPYYSDFTEIKQAVVSSKLTVDDLIQSRKDYTKQGESSH